MSDHEAIMAILGDIRGDVTEIKSDVKAQNSRVRKCEAMLASHQWAIFIGGGSVVSILLYLLYKHMAV